MTGTLRARDAAFRLAILAVFGSVVADAIGVVRAHHVEGYLQQADAAVPFVRIGTLLALLAFILCFFGRGKARIAGVISSAALLIYWLLIAESLY